MVVVVVVVVVAAITRFHYSRTPLHLHQEDVLN